MLNIIQMIHRFAGLFSSILIIFLVFTGLLLNHREELNLHERYPRNPAVLWLYGFQEEYKADADYIKPPPTWEKVATAFHGGRIFGKPVYLFLDLIGVLIIIQVITGPYIWLKRFKMNEKL